MKIQISLYTNTILSINKNTNTISKCTDDADGAYDMNRDVFKNKSHPGESAPTVVNGRNAQVMPEKQPSQTSLKGER